MKAGFRHWSFIQMWYDKNQRPSQAFRGSVLTDASDLSGACGSTTTESGLEAALASLAGFFATSAALVGADAARSLAMAMAMAVALAVLDAGLLAVNGALAGLAGAEATSARGAAIPEAAVAGAEAAASVLALAGVSGALAAEFATVDGLPAPVAASGACGSPDRPT